MLRAAAHRVGYSLLALGLAAPGVASAQSYEAPPPIAVPTSEVKLDTNPLPQGSDPAPSTPPAPKPAPKPAEVSAPKTTTSEAPPSEKKDADAKPKPVYDNEGVFKLSGSKSGATTAAKKIAKAKAPSAPVAEWPGFRMLEGGASEVIVEFSKEPSSPTEHRAAGSITYVFKGAQVARANNKNPLITLHFDTPVSSAQLVGKKGELHLVILLRPGVDVAATSGMRAPGDGEGKQFFVRFPAGSWLPQGGFAEEPVPTQKLKLQGQPEQKKPEETKPEEKKPESGGSKTGPQP